MTLEARKIISCVYRLKQRDKAFGKTMISDILRGSKGEKITRFGLETLSVWGIMAETKAHRIREIIDFMIEDGCLELAGIEYPVVVLGEGCNEIIKEERRLHMKLPKERPEAAREKPSSYRSAEAARSRGPDGFGDPGDAELDWDLFERVKDLRRKIAARESVPAYIVFSDATLRDMCRRKPKSLVQFSAVKGVGSVKLEKYGEAFLEVILGDGAPSP